MRPVTCHSCGQPTPRALIGRICDRCDALLCTVCLVDGATCKCRGDCPECGAWDVALDPDTGVCAECASRQWSEALAVDAYLEQYRSGR